MGLVDTFIEKAKNKGEKIKFRTNLTVQVMIMICTAFVAIYAYKINETFKNSQSKMTSHEKIDWNLFNMKSYVQWLKEHNGTNVNWGNPQEIWEEGKRIRDLMRNNDEGNKVKPK